MLELKVESDVLALLAKYQVTQLQRVRTQEEEWLAILVESTRLNRVALFKLTKNQSTYTLEMNLT